MNARLKGRLFGVIYFLLMAGCVAFNWYLLINEGYFYPKEYEDPSYGGQ